MLKRISFLFALLWVVSAVRADEGMWLPHLLKKLNESDMQRMGLKLTAEQIYSINQSSLKDGVVNFGNFCSGEIVSAEGLILTNHHCGFDAIQSHSTVQNDYLTNGFWAMTRKEEKNTPGLTASFLVRIEDVTDKILGPLSSTLTTEKKEEAIAKKIEELEKTAIEGTHYNAEIKPFFEGNHYYLLVYETYKDIRMVGAPPSSVGKFGGDTDNWMWPRHTGDFSMFRVYTGPDGKPAEYSEANIPLKSKFFFPISLKGVKKDDFSMVMGYPGGTDRYMSSEAVKMALEQSNPSRVRLREKRLAVMKEFMDADPEIKLKYAGKYAHVSNYYKYFIGQNQGLRRLKVVERKVQEENSFASWVTADEERKKKYGTVLSDLASGFQDLRKVNKAYVYLEEGAFAVEGVLLAYRSLELYGGLKAKATPDQLKDAIAELKAKGDEHFKDYYAPLDQKEFAELFKLYFKDIPVEQHPSIMGEIQGKYKGDFEKYAANAFSKSIFSDRTRFDAFLKSPSVKVLDKDPLFKVMTSVLFGFRQKMGPQYGGARNRIDQANNQYLAAILDMRKNDKLYPDANFTMRLTYGSVQDIYPADAVYYNYATTIDGIMAKEDSTNEEFIVPAKMKSLYAKKDFGKYVNEKGTVPVCFITTNDITGGNSGSPVINGEGHLIGIAFDGNWEAMSGDIIFEPKLQRCIAVDIRYVLFMIDKYAGAGHLVKEMKLIE